MMNDFTPRARQVIQLARNEAERFNHQYVGTEHLLLGLIALGEGVAVNVLEQLGVDLEALRLEVEKAVGQGPETKVAGTLPLTPRAKKVLALAKNEAGALNHDYIGTEHILLGLLREEEGVAARVLRNLNVDIEHARLEVLKELNPDFDHAAAVQDAPTGRRARNKDAGLECLRAQSDGNGAQGRAGPGDRTHRRNAARDSNTVPPH